MFLQILKQVELESRWRRMYLGFVRCFDSFKYTFINIFDYYIDEYSRIQKQT
jgi:hypothetical protein